MFFESISSDLSYCCIGDFNETSGLGSALWTEGSNWTNLGKIP
jgi:hypothetical protein